MATKKVKKAAPKKAAKPKSKAAPKVVAKDQPIKLLMLGGEIRYFAEPLTLGELRSKVTDGGNLQALVNGEPENNDSAVLLAGDTVSFTAKVKGN